MKDIRAVLVEKEAEHKRLWAEVTALRYAVKVCAEPGDLPLPEPKKDTADAVIDAWPGVKEVEKRNIS